MWTGEQLADKHSTLKFYPGQVQSVHYFVAILATVVTIQFGILHLRLQASVKNSPTDHIDVSSLPAHMGMHTTEGGCMLLAVAAGKGGKSHHIPGLLWSGISE